MLERTLLLAINYTKAQISAKDFCLHGFLSQNVSSTDLLVIMVHCCFLRQSALAAK